jgi:hypothetical protein
MGQSAKTNHLAPFTEFKPTLALIAALATRTRWHLLNK